MDGSVDGRAVKQAIRRAPRRLAQEVKAELRQVMRELDAELQQKRLRGRPGLRRRSGRLAQSFRWAVAGERLGDIKAVYGTNVSYAEIQEKGAVVTPRRGRYLTIPLEANLTPAGVMRQALPSFPVVRFIRSRKGNLIALAGTSRRNLQPMFVLKRRVRIKGRLGLFALWRQKKATLERRLGQAARRALAK